jgi:hypothetical protein
MFDESSPSLFGIGCTEKKLWPTLQYQNRELA